MKMNDEKCYRNIEEGFHCTVQRKTSFIIPKRYSDLKVIGQGSFGVVCSAFDSIKKGKVVIKKLNRPMIDAFRAKCAYREIRMMKHLHHENIISLYDVFTSDSNINRFRDVYLVTEFMEADLEGVLSVQKLSDDHIKCLMYQILRALKYVHSAGIIHRDLKPANIAVNENCDLKILDFGLSRPLDEKMTGYVMTRWYRAPEIMLDWMKYSCTVDIWSVGCIFAEMLSGTVLFRGKDHIDQLMRIMDLIGTPDMETIAKMTSTRSQNYIRSLPLKTKKDFKLVFKGTNPDGIDLLEKMLDLNPDTRIDSTLALSHEYLKEYSDPPEEPTCELFDENIEHKNLPSEKWRYLIWNEFDNFQ